MKAFWQRWQARWRYSLDEFFARSNLSLLLVPAGFTLLLIFASASAISLLHIQPEGGSFWQVFWHTLLRALDPGTISGDSTENLPFLLIMLLVTLSGIMLVSLLIGLLDNILEAHIYQLRKGRSQVPEEDHYVILGWSPQIYLILRELIVGHNGRGVRIVILADRDKMEMDDAIRERVLHPLRRENGWRFWRSPARVICRTGNPMEPLDLNIVNPQRSRAVLILSEAEEGSDPVDRDIYTVKTVLALTHSSQQRRLNIVAAVHSERTLAVLADLEQRHDIFPIYSQDIIARIMAQTALQAGLSSIYTDLLNFEGDEVYMKEAPALTGRAYAEALLAYETSAVLGLVRNGRILLNPHPQTRLLPDDQIVAISRDEDSLQIDARPAPLIRREFFSAVAPETQLLPTARVLVFGWNSYAPLVLEQMLQYISQKSTLTIVTNQALAHRAQRSIKEQLRARVRFEARDATDRQALAELRPETYDHVLLLSNDALDPQRADAHTLYTLLHLRDMMKSDRTPFTLVSEMRDLLNRKLATAAQVDDFIVSDHLISLLMVQLVTDQRRHALYRELFAVEGAEIYLKPITRYVQTGVPVNFYTLVASAARYGETAIGYRLGSQVGQEARLNPPKAETLTFSAQDQLIVLAEG